MHPSWSPPISQAMQQHGAGPKRSPSPEPAQDDALEASTAYAREAERQATAARSD